MPDVICTGPVFDGRAIQAAEAYCRANEATISNEAVTRIQAFLPQQYKYLGHSGGNPQDNPVPDNAGYYEAHIRADQTTEGAIVTDDNVSYGPWLEGVSERNQSGRFSGYFAFRTISEQLDREAIVIAERELPPFLVRMN